MNNRDVCFSTHTRHRIGGFSPGRTRRCAANAGSPRSAEVTVSPPPGHDGSTAVAGRVPRSLVSATGTERCVDGTLLISYQFGSNRVQRSRCRTVLVLFRAIQDIEGAFCKNGVEPPERRFRRRSDRERPPGFIAGNRAGDSSLDHEPGARASPATVGTAFVSGNRLAAGPRFKSW